MTAHYSFNWAEGVVDKVQETYPCATEILCRVLNLTRKNLAAYLARNDPLWHFLRTEIHYIDLLLKDTGEESLNEAQYVSLDEHLRAKGGPRIVGRLDSMKVLNDA